MTEGYQNQGGQFVPRRAMAPQTPAPTPPTPPGPVMPQPPDLGHGAAMDDTDVRPLDDATATIARIPAYDYAAPPTAVIAAATVASADDTPAPADDAPTLADDSSAPADDAAAPGDAHAKPGKKPKKPVSRRRKIITRTLIVFAVVIALVLGVGVFYLWKATSALCAITNGNNCNVVSITDAAGKVLKPPPNVGTPVLKPLATDKNGRTNVLLLGTSDDRSDTGGGSWLTDSILIISFSQTAHDAFMISIPRDLWVDYGGWCSFGYHGKVNVAFECKGAGSKATAKQIQAALTGVIPVYENITGLQIQYAANLNYSVLVSLVKAVGSSITVDLYPTSSRGIYDVNTGLKLVPKSKECPGAGTKPMTCTLTPYMALKLARARGSDGGYGLAGSNFAREQNQQAIIVGLMNKAKTNGFFTNLGGVSTALSGIGQNLRSTFSVDDIPSLAALAQNTSPSSFTSLDFTSAKPSIVRTATVSNQSSVVPIAGMYNYTAIRAWIAKNMQPKSVAAEAATVDVYSSDASPDIGSSTAVDLKGAGFRVGTIGTFPDTGATTTQVYNITGKHPLTSAALAQQFGVTVKSGAPDWYTTTDKADFLVIVGG